jgi:peptide/nickel transport system permease protein
MSVVCHRGCHQRAPLSHKPVIRYLFRRAGHTLLALFVVSLVTFTIFVKLPSADPARRAAGRLPTAHSIENARTRFGLDQPVIVQYLRFAQGLVPWPGLFLNEDVYYSYVSFVPVRDEILSRLPVTLTLSVGAATVWLVIGLGIGILAGWKSRTRVDRVGMILAVVFLSVPPFWLGLVLLYVFWFELGISPGSGIPIGMSVPEAVMNGRFLLPWIALGLGFAGYYARLARSGIIEVKSRDFIALTARAKGLPERRIVRHGVRYGLAPVVTILGVDLGGLLSGAVVIEVVFGLPGIGKYALDSALASDFPSVMAITLLAALFIAGANLVVDVAYCYIDPRVRYR